MLIIQMQYLLLKHCTPLHYYKIARFVFLLFRRSIEVLLTAYHLLSKRKLLSNFHISR